MSQRLLSPVASVWVVSALMAAILSVGPYAVGLLWFSDSVRIGLWWLLLCTLIFLLLMIWRPPAAAKLWWAFSLFFGLHVAVEIVTRGFFGSKPQPAAVAEALANTSAAESMGFLLEHQTLIMAGAGFFLLTFVLGWAGYRLLRGMPAWRPGKGAAFGLVLLAGFTVLLHFNPAMLRTQPFLRWGVMYVRHVEAQQEIRQIAEQRALLWENRQAWQEPHDTDDRTVVVVIGESDNRLNWSLYGYPRPTNAPLKQALDELDGRWALFPDPVSTEAFTLPSLKKALTDATDAQPELWSTTPDLVMLGRSAGYAVAWLSNQPKGEGLVCCHG